MDLLTLAQINKLKKGGGIGYSEYKTIELLSEQPAAEEMLASICPNAGDEVTVYLNGVAYTQAAKYSELNGIQCVYVGNGVDFNGEETEDGFGLGFVVAYGAIFAIFVPYGEIAEVDSITISATGKIRIVNPIDKAYIPFWNLRFYSSSDSGMTITANGEPLDFDKAVEIAGSGIPCAITYHNELDCPMFSPCSVLYAGSAVWFHYHLANLKDSFRLYIDSDNSINVAI